MVMGFVLPFSLAFAAIPLESFISSSRTVAGIVAAGILRAIAFILQLIGNTGLYLGKFIISIYDLVIFPTIWLESVIVAKKSPAKKSSKATPKKDFLKNQKSRSQTKLDKNKEQPA